MNTFKIVLLVVTFPIRLPFACLVFVWLLLIGLIFFPADDDQFTVASGVAGSILRGTGF